MDEPSVFHSWTVGHDFFRQTREEKKGTMGRKQQ
jgi:hypothetical protein